MPGAATVVAAQAARDGADAELCASRRPLVCLECDAESEGAAIGWKAYLAEVEDEEGEVGIFCPECSYAEFERD